MQLASSISVTDATSGSTESESSFLPTNAITLNFDGTLDFNDNDLTITDTSKVTVNYDSDNSGSDDTELKIYSQGNNSYISTKADSTGTITSIDNVGTTLDTTAPDITSASSYSVEEGNTTIATLTANENVTWSISGGPDAAAFNLNSYSGALSFSFTPDFETPVDTGFNNTYEVQVTATDNNSFPSEKQTISVSVVNDSTDSESSGTYAFERTTDLSDVDTGIGLFNKNVLINYLTSELSNNFGSLSGTSLASYSRQLAELEFNFATLSGSLNMSGFNTTSLTIEANNVVYRGTPIDVSGASDISDAQIDIPLN
jgi:hypothetical protein